jgi:hypothetical protein
VKTQIFFIGGNKMSEWDHWDNQVKARKEFEVPIHYDRCTECGRLTNVKALYSIQTSFPRTIRKNLCYSCKEKICKKMNKE